MKSIATTSPIPNCNIIQRNITTLTNTIAGINNLINILKPQLSQKTFELSIIKMELARTNSLIQKTQVKINGIYTACDYLYDECLNRCHPIKGCSPSQKRICTAGKTTCIVGFGNVYNMIDLQRSLSSFMRALPALNLSVQLLELALVPLQNLMKSYIAELSAKQKELQTQKNYCKVQSCASCLPILAVNKNARKNIRRKS